MEHSASSKVHMYRTLLPPREPEQRCESCDVLGTIGRLTRFEQDGRILEMHRFCAKCWPEQSARYQARWKEEKRLAKDAREKSFREAAMRDDPEAWMSSSWSSPSTEIVCGTWHNCLELLEELRSQPDSMKPAKVMAEIVKEIKEQAPEIEGPMPWEVEQFIAQYDRELTAEELAEEPDDLHGEKLRQAIADVQANADTLLSVIDDLLEGDGLPVKSNTTTAANDDVDALIRDVSVELEREVAALSTAVKRRATALAAGQEFTARRAALEMELLQEGIAESQALLSGIEGFEDLKSPRA